MLYRRISVFYNAKAATDILTSRVT